MVCFSAPGRPVGTRAVTSMPDRGRESGPTAALPDRVAPGSGRSVGGVICLVIGSAWSSPQPGRHRLVMASRWGRPGALGGVLDQNVVAHVDDAGAQVRDRAERRPGEIEAAAM